MAAQDTAEVIADHAKEGISFFLQAILSEAFVESGETDVFEWCDGKTLRELVGPERVTQMYNHPEKRFVGLPERGWEFLTLQDNINFGPTEAILVSKRYYEGSAGGFDLWFTLEIAAPRRQSIPATGPEPAPAHEETRHTNLSMSHSSAVVGLFSLGDLTLTPRSFSKLCTGLSVTLNRSASL